MTKLLSVYEVGNQIGSVMSIALVVLFGLMVLYAAVKYVKR
ncbi:hypothetical protein LX64_03731 [Chitinophaga skermanii]|uniref:Uncharacterized protein n=1 Tax=Chitinophaga skermanii TaxID=331697 RepID=A0A327QA53_9BACT|nr:hypothetical protein [Chitinophaga skermanii]RAJ01516.1 hypothetical protein LX64_03731 [Chitinophaga skermanii]